MRVVHGCGGMRHVRSSAKASTRIAASPRTPGQPLLVTRGDRQVVMVPRKGSVIASASSRSAMADEMRQEERSSGSQCARVKWQRRHSALVEQRSCDSENRHRRCIHAAAAYAHTR